nr:MAG TPA: Nuclease [Caudoviricetes sp.]
MGTCIMSELELQIAIADYLRLRYPDILFHSDFGSGVHLTVRQAVIQKRQNGGRRGYPDLFVAEPRGKYHGLYIEIKKDGEKLTKKDGSWRTPHIAEQAKMLEKLRQAGYKAEFGIGFEGCKKIIDDYLRN